MKLDMQLIGLVRLILQTLALALFLYQMTLAVQKYMDFTTKIVEETKNISQAKLPSIMIIKQENKTEAEAKYRELGYTSAVELLSGISNPLAYNVSWEVSGHNLGEIVDSFFESYDNSSWTMRKILIKKRGFVK